MRPGSFVDLLSRIQKERGWSRYRLAKELGISQTSLNYYAANPGSIKLPLLCRLREIIELSWEKFGKFIEEQHAEIVRKKRI